MSDSSETRHGATVTGAGDQQQPRPVASSRAETIHFVLPGSTNALGTLFGGTVMQWIDEIASVSAARHAGGICVTAAVDALQFLEPIQMGDLVVMKSQVNMAASTSMEVGVRVEVEDPRTGVRRMTTRAFLTFVAIDGDGKPRRVPPLLVETGEESRRQGEAQARRQGRMASRAGHKTATATPAGGSATE